MWGSHSSARAGAQALSLEVCAEQAGAALACAYANSAEYDAALIAARRAAGVYGPKRKRRQLVTATGFATCLAIALALVIILTI